MAFFGRVKKEELKDDLFKANTKSDGKGIADEGHTDSMDIRILGSGCRKCNELESNTKRALEELGIDSVVDHVTDFSKIAEYGVMSTPALVVDGKVISYGKVLKKDELVRLLGKIKG